MNEGKKLSRDDLMRNIDYLLSRDQSFSVTCNDNYYTLKLIKKEIESIKFVKEIMYRGIRIGIKIAGSCNIYRYKAIAQIYRPDAGAYPDWHDDLEEAIEDEKIYIDNMLKDSGLPDVSHINGTYLSGLNNNEECEIELRPNTDLTGFYIVADGVISGELTLIYGEWQDNESGAFYDNIDAAWNQIIIDNEFTKLI